MTHTTAHVLPAHWPEEVKAAFWTAVNAPTTVQAAAATLAFAERLAAPVSSPADPTGLRDRIAAAMREHWLSTTRDEADADGNLPCRCGEWREPGAEADDENDWESHLADAVLAVLPSPADRAAVPHDVELLHVVDAYLTATHVARHDVIGENGSCAGCGLQERLRAELRRVAAEEQPTQTQARPLYHRWYTETRDGVADEWAPGMRFTNRAEALDRYRTVSARHPLWKDGTPVERRFVRETTSYTVEEPERPVVGEQPDTQTLRCVCGHPVQLQDADDPTSWIHTPGRDNDCIDARPRCPHCQLPHDLTPGSLPVTACESIRARITAEEPPVVAYRNPALTELHCLRCAPHPAGDIWTPVTAAELEDGGICTVCGTDVLIPLETDHG